MVSSKLIVSFTSFPPRIKTAVQVVQNMMAQTKQPDRICLYLSKKQFPKLEKDLPKELIALQKDEKFVIAFVEDDLKGHKKYFYAMQEFPDDIIVTIDDDIIYPLTLLEQLYQSYLKYPKAVCTCRAHYMVMQDGVPARYAVWLNCSDECIGMPSMQLFATGGAGALYPPHIFDSCKDILFDKDLIKQFCLSQDDVWLKTAELLAKVPVVLADKNLGLKYIPDTQDVGLWKTINRNMSGSGETPNDEAFKKIISWADNNFGKGKLLEALYLPEFKQTELTEEKKYTYYHSRIQNLQEQARKSYQAKKTSDEKLRKSGEQNRKLSSENVELQKKYQNISQKITKLQKENSSLKAHAEHIGQDRERIQYDFDQMANSVSFRVGRKITYLPRKIRDLFRS